MIVQKIELNDAVLACRESGSGVPVVLVHASLSDMRSWEPIEQRVSKAFRVVNYSRRFHFPNLPIEKDGDDTLSQHADDLIALIEKLQLGKAHLVGNSSGAFVCLLAAQRRPDIVRTLTLEEPPVVSLFLKTLPPGPAESLKLLLSSPAAFVAFAKFGAGAIGPATAAFRKGDDGTALDHFVRGVVGAAYFSKITPARRQQMVDNVSVHRASLLGSGLPVFTAGDAGAIRIPTQLVCGNDTPSFQRRINRRLAELIPGAKDVCVPNASHFVHEDNPQAVADLILDFCGKHG
jgi:pimeloyl-ACP methyl ester carboxylesterase